MSLNYGCNDNEKIILGLFDKSPVNTLKDLAEHCPSGQADYTSWARNSLRKPVKHGFIAKVGRGRYEVTPKMASFDGAKLANARKKAHMSQADLCKAIGASGRQRVSDFERGAKRPSLVEFYALTGALKIRTKDLFPVIEPQVETEAKGEVA